MPTTYTLSNTHNNPGPHVDYFETNLSTSSCADQYVVSDEINCSYNRTELYPTDSVVFHGSKSHIGIDFLQTL